MLKRLIFLSTHLIPLSLAAQQTAPNFEAFTYDFVGPVRGGRVTAVSGVASQMGVFYFGATGGGVWKSEDYGVSWENVSDGFFETPSIGALCVAPSDPNIVYVGTGSDALRSNIINGKGVYKSVNAGKTWQHAGLRNAGLIGAVEVHPIDHNSCFVAAIGQPFQPNPERGVFRTRDGGQTWQKVLFLSDTTGFADLELLPSNPNIIFAAAWRAERKPWTIVSGGRENGIYKSVDGGDTWVRLTNGLPTALAGKIDLAVCPADSKVVYALVEAPGEQGGLYRSDDQGGSFRKVSSYDALRFRPFYFCNVACDPTDPDVVYVMALRLYRSSDGGKTWRTLPTPHGDDHDIWINPNNPNIFIEANDGGANVTTNGGRTWSSQFNQPTAELYQVEVDDQYPYWLYAGQQDNYTAIAVPSLPPAGHQLGAGAFVLNVGGCETGPAVPKPDNPDIVYANCKGQFSVYNKRTGQEQAYDVGGLNMYGHNPKDLRYRFQRVSPIHVSPHNPDVVYHCSQFVHRSRDDGKTWETISPDLTANEPDKQVVSGTPITRDVTGEEFYSTIYSIRESPLQEGLLWVGANDGPVHLTRDGGKSWKKVTPKNLPPGGRVDAVEPSPHNPARAYIAALRYQLGDWHPYIFKTENYGDTWALLTTGNNGLPADCPTRVVREDPTTPGLLFAGTECSVFISFDNGQRWHAFQQNLPITPVTDLRLKDEDLVLSTMGRGFWICRNISPLRQGFRGLPSENIHLYAPAPAIRTRAVRGRGIEAVGSPSYPPGGAVIDYSLANADDQPLRLEVLDARGQVVRSLVSSSGSTENPESRTRDIPAGLELFTYSAELKTSSGMYRIRWDMRHTGPWSASENSRYRNGPPVSPGSYTVRLVIGAETFEQPLQVLPDPRVTEAGVTLDDLRKQEVLALQVAELLSKVNRLVDSLRSEQKALEQKEKKGVLSPEDAGRLAALREKLSLLVNADEAYPQNRLQSQIRYLYGIVNGADQRPGWDAYQRFDELRKVVAGMME